MKESNRGWSYLANTSFLGIRSNLGDISQRVLEFLLRWLKNWSLWWRNKGEFFDIVRHGHIGFNFVPGITTTKSFTKPTPYLKWTNHLI